MPHLSHAISSENQNLNYSHVHVWYISRQYGVMFVYEGYRVKVKVTGVKTVKNPHFRNVKLGSAITLVR